MNTKTLMMAVAAVLAVIPAVQAAPPDKTLDKLEGKKKDQLQNELGRGSEQGQTARQHRKKWWIFMEEEVEAAPLPVEEPDPIQPPEEDPQPDLPPDASLPPGM